VLGALVWSGAEAIRGHTEGVYAKPGHVFCRTWFLLRPGG
jgi:hypothetical protein